MEPSDPGNASEGSRRSALILACDGDLRKYFGTFVGEPDLKLLQALVVRMEPWIYRKDQMHVAASDPAETDRLRSGICKMLGVDDDSETRRDLGHVMTTYGSANRTKLRPVIYYAMAVHMRRQGVFLSAADVPTGLPAKSDPAQSKEPPVPNEGNGNSPKDDTAKGSGVAAGPGDKGGPPANGGPAGEKDPPAPGGSNGNSSDNGSGSGGGNIKEGGKKMPGIIFIDARDAEDAANVRLNREFRNLEYRSAEGRDGERRANLSVDEQKKYDLLKKLREAMREREEKGSAYALEDTYVALRQQMKPLLGGNAEVPNLKDGAFGNAEEFPELATAAVWGALTGDGVVAPAVLDAESYDNGEITLQKPSSQFSQAMTSAFAEFTSNQGLYKAVLAVMASAADVNESGEINARDWVAVTRNLIGKGVSERTPSLAGRIRSAIEDRLSPSKAKVTATAQIVIPDLERNTAQEVQRVNLEAAQAIYFAAMMDEARLFDVVDKMAELFQIGALPLERGPAGEYLYRYIRNTPERISAYERRNTYARVFGVATGDPNAPGARFRNFDDLWLRFVSAVSDWYRKQQVESLFASNGRFVPSQEQLRKTGLDLAANLSLYCYGGTWFVASELQKDIAEYVDLLSSPEIKRLYGARDMWQVIDQISLLEFGKPANTIRARTMASAGATIIGWLEKKSAALGQPGSVLVDPSEISNPPSRSTVNSINDPSDYDLLTACEQWLAIEGVGGDIVEAKASASPSAVSQTTPVRIPPAAQDILGAFGFSHDPQAGSAGNYRNGAARPH